MHPSSARWAGQQVNREEGWHLGVGSKQGQDEAGGAGTLAARSVFQREAAAREGAGVATRWREERLESGLKGGGRA